MKYPLILTVAMALSVSVFGQANYELGIFVGASNYAGDLLAATVPRFEENGIGVGIIGRTGINRQFNVRTNLLLGTLEGDDYNYQDRMNRGFKFTSSLAELSVVAEWEPLGNGRFFTDARGDIGMKNIISPYLYTGLGIAFVTYQVDFSRNQADWRDYMIAIDRSIGESNTVVAMPIGAGVKFDLHPRFAFGLELSGHYPFSDYIDGISMAGNEDNSDWYFFGGLTATYRFLDDRIRRR